MALEVRRIVTGYDENGKSVVIEDALSKNVMARRPGMESTVIWATDQLVPDLGNDKDISADVKSTTIENGTVCRIGLFNPGVAARIHRTESIDYAIVMSGEMDMELENGEVVHITQGDVIVQRGTVHNWVNNGTEPCMMAFVLIHAKLPEFGDADGKAFG
jgi:quercetin dioxygenase-like cupin family protein